MASIIGTMIGKYQIKERLGRGGMADVFKAYHAQLDRYAAIKILHAFLAEGDDFLARFQREAKAVAALHHPNIVQIFDFDTEDDMYYMVMEYIDAGTLKEYLSSRTQPVDYTEIIRIITETASALAYAHAHGVLHRDVKPANILLSSQGRVVLTDFGIARILSETQFTATGSLVGTPAYMSPEQGMGMTLSPASDLYSLGIILYEMVTGKVPFESDTPLAIIHQHINAPLPGILKYRSDVPYDLKIIIEKTLKKEPEERYQTVEEFIHDLKALQIGKKESPIKPDSNTVTKMNPKSESQVIVSDKETVNSINPDSTDQQKPMPTLTERPTIAMDEPPENLEMETTKIPENSETIPVVKTSENTPIPFEIKKGNNPNIKKWGIIGFAVLALAALIIWGVPKLSGNSAQVACDNLEKCQQLAEESIAQQNSDEAIAYLDEAIHFVPDTEHAPNAGLWCFRGEILQSQERIDEAMDSYQICFDWTEGDPGLEDLRVFAMEHMDALR